MMDRLDNTAHQMQREDFFGHENTKKVIFTMIEAAKKRREQPGHILLYGPEGSGKKYFADIIAQEIGNKAVYIDVRSRTAISPSDLVGFLTSMENGNTLECVSKCIMAQIMQEVCECRPNGRRRGSARQACQSAWRHGGTP